MRLKKKGSHPTAIQRHRSRSSELRLTSTHTSPPLIRTANGFGKLHMRSLARCGYLRPLTIKSPELDHTFVAEFGCLGQLTNLRHLGLSVGWQVWMLDGLYRIVETALPWLTSSDLQPLQDIDKANAHRWLAELGRPDLRFCVSVQHIFYFICCCLVLVSTR